MDWSESASCLEDTNVVKASKESCKNNVTRPYEHKWTKRVCGVMNVASAQKGCLPSWRVSHVGRWVYKWVYKWIDGRMEDKKRSRRGGK